MSHDGSSAKSYIRHATEKERLDNLAFTSFPEDYLPYAANHGQNRGTVPPPYLLWGDDNRRRRPPKRRRNPKCAGALLCAIALVVVAILAVVAISVYLGVVTNLFRSPVVSLSGRFTVSEEFSEELLNSSSSQFLEKVNTYQSKVEKAFLSSNLEPAFIAARIHSFRPGLVVFFRVYLDRRKISGSEEESPPSELVRELVAETVANDPYSVYVEESDSVLSTDAPSSFQRSHTSSPTPSPKPSTTTQTPPNHPRQPAVGGVGLWRPVPIEDSVSPSFVNRPQGGSDTIRSPVESLRNPSISSGAAQELPQKDTAAPTREEGVGSVRVLEEPRLRNSPSSPRLEGVATVRLLEDIVPDPPILSENPPRIIGSARPPKKITQKPPVLPENAVEGIGTVRLLDETPLKNTQTSGVSRIGVGIVRGSEAEATVRKQPSQRFLNEGVRTVEEPPTLAPSVSLVIRNRSRSDSTRNLATRLEKTQSSDIVETENIGVGSVREIITEDETFPTNGPPRLSGLANRLLNSDSDATTIRQNNDEILTTTTEVVKEEANETESDQNSTDITSAAQDDLFLTSNDEVLKHSNLFHNDSVRNTETSTLDDINISVASTTVEEKTNQETTTNNLENILFNRTQNLPSTIANNEDSGTNAEIETSTSSANYEQSNVITGMESSTIDTSVTENLFESNYENETEFPLDATIINLFLTTNEPEDTSEADFLVKEDSDEDDVHSTVVNHSQYPNPEPHYHTIEKDNNISSIESLELHTLVGHGFHSPKPNINESVPEVSSLPSAETNSSLEIESTSTTQQHNFGETTTAFTFFMDNSDSSYVDEEFEKSLTPEKSDLFKNDSFDFGDVWSADEDANLTAEDKSQQPKVVPQLQSEFLSNDIGNEEESGDDENRFEGEVFRHITTVRPQLNGSNQACPSGMVRCSVSGGGCGIRCDMRRDCPNSEDEHGCSCSDLLRTMGQTHKLCDGVNDCDDGSDETDCAWCPSVGHFKCPASRTCISLERVCDGREDCPGKQDESRCVTLADSSNAADSLEYRSKGYLLIRRNGRWGKLCLDALAHNPDLDRRTKDLGTAVCATLTYRNMTLSVRTRDKSETEDSYFQISSETSKNRSSIFELSPCKGREVLNVECSSLECGLRPSVTPSQRRRIVGGRSVESSGSWPWAAALYREGDFQCGAALINDIWLISAAHCFYSSLGAYWIARMGMLRRGLELPSSGEHVRRIQQFILHPQYEDIGFINDIALLRMDKPVPFSDYLRPICLPSSTQEDASLWHGRRCSVVGWGKLFEIGHTFPDTLQEVRLPVISSTECQRRSLFLPAYRVTPNMFCAGYERGGRDACLGDSGGPMACQRPADSRWVLLGVTSNGDGCGRPNRPGVYTQVASYLPWLLEVINNPPKVSDGKSASEPNCTEGIRCRLGRCILQGRVCDGRRDCATGEDEEHC